MNDITAWVAISVCTVLGLLSHMPSLIYTCKKIILGKNALRLWYFNEAGNLDTTRIKIGTEESSKEISYQGKSFLYDPKKTFYFPKRSGMYSGELSIMYVHNSCYPVDVHTIFLKEKGKTPDELDRVLRSKLIKEFMTPTDLVKGAMSIGAFILIGIVLYILAAKMGWIQ